MEDITVRVGALKRVPNPMGFTDDIYMACEECGAELMLRPNGPLPPEVKLLCFECALPSIVEAQRNGTFEAEVVGDGKDTALGRLTKLLAKSAAENAARKADEDL